MTQHSRRSTRPCPYPRAQCDRDAPRQSPMPLATHGSDSMETLGQDYIRTARARGLSEQSLALGHALRNALLPAIRATGVNLGYLLSGAVIAVAAGGHIRRGAGVQPAGRRIAGPPEPTDCAIARLTDSRCVGCGEGYHPMCYSCAYTLRNVRTGGSHAVRNLHHRSLSRGLHASPGPQRRSGADRIRR